MQELNNGCKKYSKRINKKKTITLTIRGNDKGWTSKFKYGDIEQVACFYKAMLQRIHPFSKENEARIATAKQGI